MNIGAIIIKIRAWGVDDAIVLIRSAQDLILFI